MKDVRDSYKRYIGFRAFRYYKPSMIRFAKIYTGNYRYLLLFYIHSMYTLSNLYFKILGMCTLLKLTTALFRATTTDESVKRKKGRERRCAKERVGFSTVQYVDVDHAGIAVRRTTHVDPGVGHRA